MYIPFQGVFLSPSLLVSSIIQEPSPISNNLMKREFIHAEMTDLISMVFLRVEF